PMLVPVETPAQVLSNWPQALELVRSRSTSIAVAQSRVTEAQARSRQALSNSLPSLNGNGRVSRSLLFATAPDGTRVPSPATVWNAGVELRQSILDLRSWYDTR